ncbi:MAG TPA: protein kinase [Planctomycetota bacterium]|nr:protein kinase [Planctomycetota bacterium]
MTNRPELYGPLALQLRDAVREDLERRFGELCVSRGVLSSADLHRGLEEQKRLRDEGADASLVHALTRLGLVDGGGPLWPLFDEVLASPSEVPAPGGRLGRYELIGDVGKGGSGTVYKAYDTTLHRIVAVKTITSTLAEPAEIVRSLVREARTLAGLSHKNIVAVYDAGEIDGTPFLCMEFVEGRPLPAFAPLPLIQKVAEALAYAHARGIVHCDLKPGNILVDQDGEPRIIDFGLARVLGRRGGRGPEGTPAYMAPEQVRGDAGAGGPSVDIYSLGVCLYEALTGRRPFDGDSPQKIFDRILGGDVAPPRALRPQISRDLERICLKAMEADPKRRYASAADLAADLARAVVGRPKVSRGWIAMGVAVAASLLGVGIVTQYRAEGERQRREIDRRLDERVKPLELLILETRPFFYIKDADVAGRLAKVRTSLKELETLVQDPRFAARADLWRALGTGQYFVGDMIHAEESLRRAAAAAPQDGATHFYLGRIYLDRAIVELLTLPGRPDADRQEGSQAWERKAEEHLSRATTWEGAPELDRRFAEACLALAKGNPVEAARKCREGLVRFAGKLGVEEFSRLLGVLSPAEERIGHLTRAIEFRPHYPWAYLQRGAQQLFAGKWDAAIEDFDRALALYPQLGFALHDRGIARLAKGEIDAALIDFDEVLRLDPGNGLAWGSRALARAAKRDLQGAIEDDTRAIELYPFPAMLISNRGLHRLMVGDPDGALTDAELLLKREPSSARGFVLRGGVRSAKRDWPAALLDYDQALKLDPNLAEAFAGRGAARLSMEDRPAARADLDTAIRLLPLLAMAWFNRGSLNAEEGDLDGAITDLSEAIRLDPGHLPSLVSRGVAWEAKGELEKAIEDYDEALRRDFRYYDALFNRGMTRLAQGKPGAAVLDLQGSLQLAPADWNSRSLAETSLQEARKQLSD